MPMRLDFDELQILARANGISLMGAVTDVSLESERLALSSWQQEGYAGEMKYMKRDPSLLVDPSRILPSVKSILLCAVRYEQKRHPLRPKGFARVARYAWGKDYHVVLRDRLAALSRALEPLGIQSRAFTDAVPLLERALAAKSGVGFIGKHSLFIIPKVGSLTLLGEVLVDCEVINIPVVKPSGECGTCSQCRSACPTQAIVSDHVVDARRCISYLTIEKKGLLSHVERKMIGEWIFGCDECQEICPFNHSTIKIGGKPDLKALSREYGVGPLVDLKMMLSIREDAAFKNKFKDTPLVRPKREGLIRNGICVAVNSGAFELTEYIASCMSDSSPVVRATALWALKEFSSVGEYSSALFLEMQNKLLKDPDQRVREEASSLG